MSDLAAMTEMFDETIARFGGVDVFVNNAGIMRLTPIADADDEAFDQTLAVNLKGVFNGMREGARRLRNGGRIVSFSSSVVGLYQPRCQSAWKRDPGSASNRDPPLLTGAPT